MSDSLKTPRPMRWWMAGVILLLSAILTTWLQFSETNFRPHKTVLVIVGTLLLLAFWYILFTGLPWARRLLLLSGLVVLIGGTTFLIKDLTRVEGTYTGSGLPRLVWKWSPKVDAGLPPLETLDFGSTATNAMSQAATDFPEFLGPGRTNSVEGIRLATDWETRPPKELWRQAVGLGWSSFAIAGARAVTQEQRGENEWVVCYALTSGSPLWAHTNHVRFSEMLGGDGPRATPTIVSNRVYTLGATGILDCLDLTQGALVWSRDTLAENDLENIMWGKSSSPLVYDNLVVVSGGENGPLLLAYDRESGQPAWKGGNGRSSYASPLLATLLGQRQVLSVNAHSVTGHNATNGAVLWEYPWAGDYPKCSQPFVVGSDRVLISAGYGLGAALLHLKPTPDGKYTANAIWKNRNLKTQFTNLVIKDGYAYGLDAGILECIQLETGERQWKGGRYGHGQILRVGRVLVVQAERGPVHLVEVDPTEHREVASWPALSSKTWNTPALSGPYLLVRNDREAVCLELPLRQPD